MSLNNTFFITGTDTGIGKTVVSSILMAFMYENSHTPFYIKPFQTGCKDPYYTDSDAKFIYNNLKLKQDPAESVIFCFNTPKAPFFAARDEQKKITQENIEYALDFIRQKKDMFSHLVIEGSGGLLVPINEKMCMIDFIKLTKAKTIIVARAGLGTINHTLLSIEALEKRKMQPAGIIFVDSNKTPKEMIQENIKAVEAASNIKVNGVIGWIDNFEKQAKNYYEVFKNILI